MPSTTLDDHKPLGTQTHDLATFNHHHCRKLLEKVVWLNNIVTRFRKNAYTYGNMSTWLKWGRFFFSHVISSRTNLRRIQIVDSKGERRPNGT